MKSTISLLAPALALFALGIFPAQRTAAQEIGFRRDVPAPVVRDCSVAERDARTPVSASQDPREAARLAAAAREAALLGDPRTARDLLARAAHADTTAANIAFLFARTLEELGEIDDAVGEYCRYLQLAADAADADEVRALVRRIAPPVRPGISDSAVARFHTALALSDSGRDTDAERAFSDVIAAAPAWAVPYYNRALLRARAKRRDDARTDLEQFLALEPGSPDEARVREWLTRLAAPIPSYSPGAAFALGLIPGAGHFYTGRPIAGTALLAVAGGAAAFGVLYQSRTVDCLTVPQNNVCPADQVRGDRTERPYLLPAAGVAAAAAIIGAFDAARGARRHNARAAESGLAGRIGSAVQTGPARVDVALLRLRF
jgi:tetratricopeptide (TPR) repeat protein